MVVNIAYNANGFSIGHVSTSPNLRYTGPTVHTLYNEWVQQLERTIQQQSA